MTEREAWLTIGVAFEKPLSKRTKKQKSLAYDGVCSAVTDLWHDDLIDTPMTIRMEKKIKKSILPSEAYFQFDYYALARKENFLRAFFCYLQHYACGGE